MNSTNIRIATLNLCLGLKHKKIEVERLIRENQIDVICLQETEIEVAFNKELLDINGFRLELENNSVKRRTGVFLKNDVQYKRRIELEGKDSNLLIIDIMGKKEPWRLINVYRSFNPQGNVNPRVKFKYQLNIIKKALTQKSLLVGDFNLDYRKKYDVDYAHKNLFSDFDEELSSSNLVQMIDFETWSRLIGNELKASILDHVYIRDPTLIKDIKSITPVFGDHRLIMIDIDEVKPKPIVVYRRDWRHYSKNVLSDELNMITWSTEIDDVQGFWNHFESKLINVIDKIAPVCKFEDNVVKVTVPGHIKNKLNLRKRLLKKRKNYPSPELKARIANLNFEIRSHFFSITRYKVRKGIIPGNSKTLWQSVKLAKNQGTSQIPNVMTLDGNEVSGHDISNCFANFFEKKVGDIVGSTKVDENVYNGKKRIEAQCEMFMTGLNISECVKKIKIKNTEGYNRIPQRILVDGLEQLFA